MNDAARPPQSLYIAKEFLGLPPQRETLFLHTFKAADSSFRLITNKQINNTVFDFNFNVELTMCLYFCIKDM